MQFQWHKSRADSRTGAGVVVSKLLKERRSQLMEFLFNLPIFRLLEEFLGLSASSGVVQKVPPGPRGSRLGDAGASPLG